MIKKTVTIPADIGHIVRMKRKQDGLTLIEAAALCNVGYRFFSDLENGKTSVHLGKVLQVLQNLGIEVVLSTKGNSDE